MATKIWLGTDAAAPNDWSDADNWSPSGVPANGDHVVFDSGSVSVTAGLNQSAVTLASLRFYPTYTGNIGTTSAYLQIGATLVELMPSVEANAISGGGSGLIRIDQAAVANTANVYFTSGTPTMTGRGVLQLKGTAITLNAQAGLVDVAGGAGETATVAAAKIGVVSGNTGPRVVFGSGATITSLSPLSGTIINYSAQTMPAVVQTGGTYDYRGTGAHTSLTIRSGRTAYNGTGTLTACDLHGSLDFSGDARAKTVTNITLNPGADLNADNGVPGAITFSNPIAFEDCGVDTVKVKFGKNITLDVAYV